MMPEPTTVATSAAVPIPSATSRLDRSIRRRHRPWWSTVEGTNAAQLAGERHGVDAVEREADEGGDAVAHEAEGILEDDTLYD
jgi:hypothetical protein